MGSDRPKQKKKAHKQWQGSPQAACTSCTDKRQTIYRSHTPLPNLVLPLVGFLVCSFVFCKFNAFLFCVRNSNCLPIVREVIIHSEKVEKKINVFQIPLPQRFFTHQKGSRPGQHNTWYCSPTTIPTIQSKKKTQNREKM